MAKFPNGVLGAFHGVIGPITGCYWKTIFYGRALPVPSNKPPTPPQKQQRTRFGFASSFLSPMTDLIKTSFREYAIAMTEFNNAVSYTTKNAVSGSFPDFQIHYDRLLVSRGSLPNADGPVAVVEGTRVHFSWKDNSGLGNAKSTDKTIRVVYFPSTKSISYKIGQSRRGDETETVDFTGWKNETVHTWLAFIAADGTTSCSVYTGELVLGATEPAIFEEAQPAIQSTAQPAAMDMKQELDFKIILQDPPAGSDFALQKGQGASREIVQRQRAMAEKDLVFSFQLGIKTGKDGQPDFHGPLVQGPPGERFIYIGIGQYAGQAGGYERRLKIPLRGITWDMINKPGDTPGAGLQTVVPGKGGDGTPNCGTVKPFEGWKPMDIPQG